MYRGRYVKEGLSTSEKLKSKGRKAKEEKVKEER
jgi:hypothetical protein